MPKNPRPRYLTIDGKRVRACSGSDSLRGSSRGPRSQGEIQCPECPRVYLAAACQTYHETPVIPRHRAQEA